MDHLNSPLSLGLASLAILASSAPAFAQDSVPAAFRTSDPSLAATVLRGARKLDLPGASVDAAALAALEAGDAMPADLAGTVGGGQVVVARRAAADGGVYLHFAHPRTPLAFSDCLVRAGRVTGVVRDGLGGVESVRTLDDGRMVRQILDEDAKSECGGSIAADTMQKPHAAGFEQGGVSQGACSDGNTFDIFFVIHVDAAIEIGGLQATLDEAALAVELANTVYTNSSIMLHARMVGVRITGDAVTNGDGLNGDLAALRNASDGVFDEGTDNRAEWGADMIKLWRTVDPTDTGIAGLGYLLTSSVTPASNAGFSVDRWTVAVSNITFPHELGHNMGCCHATGDGGGCSDASGGYYSYSFGNRFTGDSGTAWRTMMAYQPGTRIPYASSPVVSYDGEFTGSATEDNRRTINNTRTVFCDFVCSTVPDNDECSQASILGDGSSLSVTNDHATNFGTSGLHCGAGDYADVWAKFTPATTGRALLRLCANSATTSEETSLSVYAGDCSGASLACDVGGFGFEFCASEFSSAVVVPVTAGTTYFVRCASENYSSFSGTLRYDLTPSADCGAGTGPCYEAHEPAGCTNLTCCATVCGYDPFCCDTTWDSLCVDRANDLCAQCGDTAASCYAAHDASGCSDADCCAVVTAIDSYCGNTAWDAACAEHAKVSCAGCGSPSAGFCGVAHAATTGCNDASCCISVCAVDAYCCETGWDAVCVGEARSLCTTGGDLDGDGEVNGADLAQMLGSWGQPGATDLDLDGDTDAADLALLLGAWGS